MKSHPIRFPSAISALVLLGGCQTLPPAATPSPVSVVDSNSNNISPNDQGLASQNQDDGDARLAVRLIIAGKYPDAAVEYGKIANWAGRRSKTQTGFDVTFDIALELFYFCSKAQAFALNGQLDKANEALFAAESISDEHPELNNDATGSGVKETLSDTKGFLAEKAGRRAEAESFYRESGSTNGKARLALFALADNRLNDAQVLAGAGESPTEQIVLGLVAAQTKHPAEAADWFDKAREMRMNPMGNEFIPMYWCEAPPP